MLELAKECQNLDVFCQVSTCYVNCNRSGYIDEVIYDHKTNVQDHVQKIMSMNIQEIKDKESELISGFPNTYTFTKNLAEKNIKNTMGNVKVIIFRPAIIASAWN